MNPGKERPQFIQTAIFICLYSDRLTGRLEGLIWRILGSLRGQGSELFFPLPSPPTPASCSHTAEGRLWLFVCVHMFCAICHSCHTFLSCICIQTLRKCNKKGKKLLTGIFLCSAHSARKLWDDALLSTICLSVCPRAAAMVTNISLEARGWRNARAFYVQDFGSCCMVTFFYQIRDRTWLFSAAAVARLLRQCFWRTSPSCVWSFKVGRQYKKLFVLN